MTAAFIDRPAPVSLPRLFWRMGGWGAAITGILWFCLTIASFQLAA